MKLDIKALGLSMGIIWGGAMFLMGLLSMYLNWGTKFVDAVSSVYIGYKPTWLGSIIGTIWGFIDGGIFGLLVAWLYNKFVH